MTESAVALTDGLGESAAVTADGWTESAVALTDGLGESAAVTADG